MSYIYKTNDISLKLCLRNDISLKLCTHRNDISLKQSLCVYVHEWHCHEWHVTHINDIRLKQNHFIWQCHSYMTMSSIYKVYNDSAYDYNVIHMCDMTHSYVRHDSFICVICHSWQWQGSFICVTWLIHMCDMTHSYVWHDSLTHMNDIVVISKELPHVYMLFLDVFVSHMTESCHIRMSHIT